MGRMVVVTVLLALAAGIGMAQCPRMGPPAPPAQQDAPADPPMRGMGAMAGGGPMAMMMAMSDIATWGGYVYVVQGNTLEKRDAEGNVVKTIELNAPGQMMWPRQGAGAGAMRGGGQGMMCGQQGGQGMMQGQRGGQGMMQGRQGGQGMMQPGGMMMCARLSADAQGVYLLRGGTITVFDHDLNRKASWRLPMAAGAGRGAMCQMRGGHEQRPTCPMCSEADRARRSIARGSVEMWHRPCLLAVGPARFYVRVFDADMQPDPRAQVSVYLYPEGDPDNGRGLQMQSLGAGEYYGLVNIPASGQWELAVRVMRPGMDDARVYYELPVR